MAKRHIKFFRYYKEWINTYKKYQISKITYSKYDLAYRYLKKVHPDLYLDELTRQKVQMIINKYGETHEIETSKDFLHRLQAPLRDAAYEGWVSKDPTYKVVPTSRIPHKVTRAKYLEADEAEKLEKVFFSDNGSSAIEVALKMSFQYHQQTGNSEKKIFVSLKIHITEKLSVRYLLVI